MDADQFRKEAHILVDWMADYFKNVEQFPVLPDLQPGEIYEKITDAPPESPEKFENIFQDFKSDIMPGITHWESPYFMAYFPANKSYASVLAEMLTATLGAQCMSWITSPAATELEDRMMKWLGRMTGLPQNFSGVIQDTASTATLCALLMAREQISGFETNRKGIYANEFYTVYCSSETHSSIEKGVKIAGFGSESLRKVDVDEHFAMQPDLLEKLIREDINKGRKPACVIATIGTTGSTAIDPLKEISDICSRYGIFLHVDAAYAGTALLLPEMRWMIEGIEQVDSFVFNPHKWMFVNFDCSAFFVKDKDMLIKTFEILPEYLKSEKDERVKNYRDWGIQLGRRFRALKLWFVIRSYGVSGLRNKIREHISLAGELVESIKGADDFKLLAPVPLNLICFRYNPAEVTDEHYLDELNERLLRAVNRTGKLFITHTRLGGKFTLRIVAGNTNLKKRHLTEAWNLIQEKSNEIHP